MKKLRSFLLVCLFLHGCGTSYHLNAVSLFDVGYQISSSIFSLPLVVVAYFWNSWIKKDIEKTRTELNSTINTSIENAKKINNTKFTAFETQQNALLGAVSLNTEKLNQLVTNFREGQNALSLTYGTIEKQCKALEDGIKKEMAEIQTKTQDQLTDFAAAIKAQVKELKEYATIIEKENTEKNNRLLQETKSAYQKAIEAIKECTNLCEEKINLLVQQYTDLSSKQVAMQEQLVIQKNQITELQKNLLEERALVKELRVKVKLLESRTIDNAEKMKEILQRYYPSEGKISSMEIRSAYGNFSRLSTFPAVKNTHFSSQDLQGFAKLLESSQKNN